MQPPGEPGERNLLPPLETYSLPVLGEPVTLGKIQRLLAPDPDSPVGKLPLPGKTIYYFGEKFKKPNLWVNTHEFTDVFLGKPTDYLAPKTHKYGEEKDVATVLPLGEELILKMGWKRFRDLRDPAANFHGVKIGAGMTSDVYAVTIGEHEYAIKIKNGALEQQRAFMRALRQSMPDPAFEYELGFTTKVGKELEHIPQQNIKIRPIKEYAATPQFMVLEKGPGLGLEMIVAVYFPEVLGRRAPPDLTEAQTFINKNGLTREQVGKIKDEIKDLDDLFNLMRGRNQPYYKVARTGIYKVGGNLHDIKLGNFLIEGVEKGVMKLVMIDQANAFSSPMGDDLTDYEELAREDREGDRRTYERLHNNPLYAQYMDSVGLKAENYSNS